MIPLIKVMAVLRPGENVSPDLSSYETMVATWRGSGNPPTLQEVEAQRAILQSEADAVQYLKDRDIEYEKQGLTIKAKVDALWEKVMEANTEKADQLQAVKESIDSVIAKP